MSFDWHDYWKFAEYCQQQSSTMRFAEAALRASISRAYYSVFCSARNVAIGRGVIFPHGNDHYEVRMYFEGRNAVAEKLLGKDLNRLRRQRNKADYDDIYRGDLTKTAQWVMALTGQMHSTIASLPKK